MFIWRPDESSPLLERHIFTVPGTPMGKPRMTRRDKWKLRPRVVRYRKWCDAIRESAGPVVDASWVTHLRVLAYFQPPKSWSKKLRQEVLGQLHRQAPDCDNVLKGVMDALWKDDSRIASSSILKRWRDIPGLEVAVYFLPAREAA